MRKKLIFIDGISFFFEKIKRSGCKKRSGDRKFVFTDFFNEFYTKIMSENFAADTLIHGIAADATVRCIAVVTTKTVSEAARRHETTPIVSVALGRILTGTLLLGASLKDFDRLTVQMICKGPVEGLIAEVNSRGNVRGYARNPKVEIVLNDDGKFDVKAIVGEGMFYVMRESGFDIGLHRDPYTGSVPIVSGEVGEDFAFYLAKSEQIPSAVLLGVLIKADEEGNPIVAASGGVLIQMMPDATDETISAIETAIKNAPHLTALIQSGATPKDLLKIALGEIEFEILEEKEVSFGCTCTRERAVSLISSIDESELRDMLEKDQGAIMNCPFCNETYKISEEELKNILSEKAKSEA